MPAEFVRGYILLQDNTRPYVKTHIYEREFTFNGGEQASRI